MPDFEKMDINDLEDLAIQAKVHHAEYLNKDDLVRELEDDFYKAWDEAYIDLHDQEHSRMNSPDSVCTCTCPYCFEITEPPNKGHCVCSQCSCDCSCD